MQNGQNILTYNITRRPVFKKEKEKEKKPPEET